MEANSKNTVTVKIDTWLFLIFLIMKLGGWGVVATWSWWWVFSPFWIPLAAVLVYIGIVSVILMIRDIFKFIQ